MGALQIVFGVILAIFAIAIIIVVQKNVGVITGGADTFFEKNQARSIDAFLARWTKVIAVGFFLLVIAINVVMFFTA